MIDPNPRVSGKGIKTLRKAGIDVATGVMAGEAGTLNEAFVKHITSGIPFVTLKIAQTLDGKIATATGESKWITGEKAREEGHRLRDSNDVIIVGINTVLKDDPSLTTRIPKGRDPVRVVVDSSLRIPLNAKVLTQRSSARTIIATLATAPKARIKKLQAAGADVLLVRSDHGRVDLKDLLKKLGAMDIMSVLIEGGSEITPLPLRAGIVDKVVMFIAPMIMSGTNSLCSVGGVSPAKLSHAVRLFGITSRFVGQDLMIEGYVRPVHRT